MTSTGTTSRPVAVITGATQGLGRALARELDDRGWQVVADGRDNDRLAALRDELPSAVVVRGDVTDPVHRVALFAAAEVFGRIDLLVNNASDLGPSPLPNLDDLPVDALRQVFETNVLAPLALTQLALPALRRSRGVVLDVSSDAAIEAYEGWGGYGASKAALDHLTRVLAVEEPPLAVYCVCPGDMRTEMHQRAFPGEDISDRGLPEDAAHALVELLERRPVSGRYRAADIATVSA